MLLHIQFHNFCIFVVIGKPEKLLICVYQQQNSIYFSPFAKRLLFVNNIILFLCLI